MTDSKWIEFVEMPFDGKTKVFKIVPKESPNTYLGFIKWYGAWRCYCFFSKADCIFETQCIGDIKRFIDALMLDRKIKKQVAQQ